MKQLFDANGFLTGFREALIKDLGEFQKLSVIHDFAYNRQMRNLEKKFLKPGNTDERKTAALAKFLQVNQEMFLLNEAYVSGSLNWQQMPELVYAKNLIYHVLGPPPSQEDVFLGSKNSSGTSIGVPYSDTSLERKSTYPLSGTKSCLRLWEHYLEYDPVLGSALDNLNEASGVKPKTVSTRGSRVSTVPKTNEIDRMISVEPTLNMYFQQGLKLLMDDRLRRIGLSLERDQELHRHLAYRGSITNRDATIDFASMSDRMSLALCHFMFPRGWLVWFLSLRSHRALLNGAYVELHMISTMGNATTFPIETLILWAIGYSAHVFEMGNTSILPDLRSINPTYCRVFGDDCIMPTATVGRFLKICSLVGFQPNVEKSFFDEKNFRESCGGDFYHGKDVRPFYLKSLAQAPRRVNVEAFLYTTLNGVIRLYKKYFGTLMYVYDKHLLRYLFTQLSIVTDEVKFVPIDFPDDSGICEMQDLERLRSCYKVRISPILINENSMLCFKYLSFKYSKTRDIDEGLRYAVWLKKPGVKRDDFLDPRIRNNRLESNIRKNGLYVQRVSKNCESLTLPSTLERRALGLARSRLRRVQGV